MKINTNSNVYTYVYASVLVVVVALVLAFTAVSLQPLQEKNVRVEKMQNILQSVGIDAQFEEAEKLYADFVTKQYAVNVKGEEIDADAFNLNLKTQFKNKPEDKKLPIYEATLKDGSKKTIIPLQGKGLWGPVWGYMALDEDFNTISGAVFDHKAETPGLGADINKDWFERQFKGKTIFDGDKLISITIHKGGKGAAKLAGNEEHGVDAISGGTITSKGLERMLKEEWLFSYSEFLKKNKK